MNSCSLGYSNFNDNEDSNTNLIQKRSNQRLQKSSNKNVEKIIEKIHSNTDNSDSDDGLASFQEFKPPAPPQITNLKNENKTSPTTSKEQFDNLDDGSYAKQYYSQYVPPQSKQNTMMGGNSELLEKLNYMIHLLEEQQDEKIGNISEEIILYAFLGIFVIFIVDSFVRVGKYVR